MLWVAVFYLAVGVALVVAAMPAIRKGLQPLPRAHRIGGLIVAVPLVVALWLPALIAERIIASRKA